MKKSRILIFTLLIVFIFSFSMVACETTPKENGDNTNPAPPKEEITWGEWEITNYPTITNDGIAQRTNNKGEIETYTLPVLTSPDYVKEIIVEATCDSTGKAKYTIDIEGNKISFEVKTNMLTHNYGDWVAISLPTEDTEGAIVSKCSLCGVEETMVLPVLSDTRYNVNLEKEATCVEDGKYKYSIATSLNNLYEFYIKVPKLGHNYKYMYDDTDHWQVCDNCDFIGEKEKHNYNENSMTCKCGKAKPGTSIENMVFSLNQDKDGYILTKVNNKETITTLVIPKTYNGLPVVEIGLGACQNAVNLKSVVLSSSIEVISDIAFAYCGKLETVTIPTNNKIKIMNSGIFRDCVSLTSFDIPKGIEQLDPYLFEGCINLESITIPNNVKVIGNQVFKDCDKIKNITIPSSVTYVGERAFSNMDLLEKVAFEDNIQIKTIARDIAGECPNLKYMEIPASLKEIQSLTSACPNVMFYTAVKKGDPNYRWSFAEYAEIAWETADMLEKDNLVYAVGLENSTLWNGSKATGDVVISDIIVEGNNVINIKEGAFKGNNNINNITLSKFIKTIGNNAFENCGNLVSVNINNAGIDNIGSMAFANCSKLNSFEFIGIKQISNNAFENAALLKSVSFTNIQDIVNIGADAFKGTFISSVNVENTDAYFKIRYENVGASMFAKDTTALYVNNEAVTSITVPETETILYPYTFYNNSSLINITIYSKELKSNAIVGCNNLEEIILSSNVEIMNYLVINDNQKVEVLVKKVIPTEWNSITWQNYATVRDNFQGFSYIDGCKYFINLDNEAILDNSNEAVGELIVPSTFVYNGNNITVKEVGWFSFQNNNAVTSLFIPNTVNTIGESAFYNMANLERLEIDGVITELPYYAFSENNKLTYVRIPYDLYKGLPYINDVVITYGDILDSGYRINANNLTLEKGVKSFTSGRLGDSQINNMYMDALIEDTSNIEALLRQKPLLNIFLKQEVSISPEVYGFAVISPTNHNGYQKLFYNEIEREKVLYKLSQEGTAQVKKAIDDPNVIETDILILDELNYADKTFKVTSLAKSSIKFNEKIQSLTLSKYITTLPTYSISINIDEYIIPDTITRIEENAVNFTDIKILSIPFLGNTKDHEFPAKGSQISLENLINVDMNTITQFIVRDGNGGRLGKIHDLDFENSSRNHALDIQINGYKYIENAIECNRNDTTTYGEGTLEVVEENTGNAYSSGNINIPSSLTKLHISKGVGIINVKDSSHFFTLDLVLPYGYTLYQNDIKVDELVWPADEPIYNRELIDNLQNKEDAKFKIRFTESIKEVDSIANGNLEFYFPTLKVWNDLTVYPYTGTNVYINNEKLVNVVWPEEFTAIRPNVFAGMEIKTLVIPNTVQSIGGGILGDVATLTSLKVPFIGKDRQNLDGLHWFMNYGSADINRALLDLEITESINEYVKKTPISIIGMDNVPINNLILPNDTTYICNYMFRGVKANNIVLPFDKLEYVGSNAFMSCKTKVIKLSRQIKELKAQTFVGAYIDELYLPYNLVTITQDDFRGSKCTIYAERAIPCHGWHKNALDYAKENGTIHWGWNNNTEDSNYDYMLIDNKAYMTKYKGNLENVSIVTNIQGHPVASYGNCFNGLTINNVAITKENEGLFKSEPAFSGAEINKVELTNNELVYQDIYKNAIAKVVVVNDKNIPILRDFKKIIILEIVGNTLTNSLKDMVIEGIVISKDILSLDGSILDEWTYGSIYLMHDSLPKGFVNGANYHYKYYYYSETNKGDRYWHYVDGIPTIWGQV